MFTFQPPSARLLAAGVAALCAVVLTGPVWGGEVATLTPAEFEKLHALLQPREQLWQTVPWQLSILEARDQAAKAKKPVFMLVRSGHPLGCV